MFFLKEDTAADIKLGPFVDKTDGVAYEVGMAAAMDHATTGVRLSKSGGAFADRNEATEPTYDAFGYYLVKLSTTDTNTPGTLKVIYGDAATTLPCEANFQVIAANAYDAMFGAGTVFLKVDVETVKTQAVTCAAPVTVLASVGTAATSTAPPRRASAAKMELLWSGSATARRASPPASSGKERKARRGEASSVFQKRGKAW